jgi:type IV secretory pathway TrbL component
MPNRDQISSRICKTHDNISLSFCLECIFASMILVGAVFYAPDVYWVNILRDLVMDPSFWLMGRLGFIGSDLKFNVVFASINVLYYSAIIGIVSYAICWRKWRYVFISITAILSINALVYINVSL